MARYDTVMRCFLAIEVPAAIRRQLAQLQERLRPQVGGVAWARSEQMHLTLKFLGEVPDADVPEAIEAARSAVGGFGSFDLTVAGAGCFPPSGSARVLWVAVHSPPELLACQQECEHAFESLGIPPENRSFHPHLTLGRVKDFHAGRSARAAIEQVADFEAGGFTARELVFFQSVLQRTGPIYTALARIPLAGGPAAR
jgi:2'-5' RNA ligase